MTLFDKNLKTIPIEFIGNLVFTDVVIFLIVTNYHLMNLSGQLVA